MRRYIKPETDITMIEIANLVCWSGSSSTEDGGGTSGGSSSDYPSGGSSWSIFDWGISFSPGTSNGGGSASSEACSKGGLWDDDL